jgi:K+-sensing histidine kinase KdpD
VYCSQRIFRSISIIQQATAEQFLTAARDRGNDREQRLRAVHRAVSEDAKSRVVLLKGAAKMLLQPGNAADADRAERFGTMLQNNIDGLGVMLDDLAELSSLDLDARQRQNILLRDAIGEAVRQLRDLASAHHVDVSIATTIPEIEVPAAVVELCVSNYVSNAIKYHDREKQDRRVRVDAEVIDHMGNCEVVVRVTDNGMGVPEHARKDLFRRLFRAQQQDVTGSGLGLSLVRDFADSVGGRAWAELDDPSQTVFCFALPCRRSSDIGDAQPAT